MNSLSGIIKSVTGNNQISLVEIDVSGALIKTVVLEQPAEETYLISGNPVKVLFKETEVILSRQLLQESTLNNAIPGVILHIERGDLLNRLEVSTKTGIVVCIASAEAVQDLKLSIGEDMILYINSMEIMLAP